MRMSGPPSAMRGRPPGLTGPNRGAHHPFQLSLRTQPEVRIRTSGQGQHATGVMVAHLGRPGQSEAAGACAARHGDSHRV